ncbi:hypothetical protein [Actinocorallia populi]|uniref:hypothetical protein n=1 Tax=Actinocorallia populi TaxID=2079200 RepID=UPI0013008CF0|nr:hypothetical protein [Actinocorallia populi]
MDIRWKTTVAAALLVTVPGCGLLPESGDEGARAAPSPTPTAVDLSPTPDVPEDEREDAGEAWPLELTKQTRLALADAAREAGAEGDAVEVETRGTVYYGVVYGRKAKNDDYYVVANTDSTHYWHRTGVGAWKYLGTYESKRCTSPVPGKLVMAWIGMPAFGVGSASPCPDGG